MKCIYKNGFELYTKKSSLINKYRISFLYSQQFPICYLFINCNSLSFCFLPNLTTVEKLQNKRISINFVLVDID